MIKQIILLAKGQTFVIRYRAGDVDAMKRALVAKAEDPECPLDWFDVAVVSHQMKCGDGQLVH